MAQEWLSSPVTGGVKTARFGESGPNWTNNHTGLDFAQSPGLPVKAVADGFVTQSGWFSQSYGNMVTLDHGGGLRTRYAHLLSATANVSEPVKKGSAIGLLDSTGNVTGPHVHLEVLENGQQRNPENYLGRTNRSNGDSSSSSGGISGDTDVSGELESGFVRIGYFLGGGALIVVGIFGAHRMGIV